MWELLHRRPKAPRWIQRGFRVPLAILAFALGKVHLDRPSRYHFGRTWKTIVVVVFLAAAFAATVVVGGEVGSQDFAVARTTILLRVAQIFSRKES